MSRQRPEKLKKTTWGISVIISICFIFILLITSFEIGAYGSWNFYQKEYEKYDVLKDVQMEMPDVMHVTKEMMSFLKGNRPNLIVDTVVNGQKMESFNKREISHMEDVQTLFVGGMNLRIAAIIFIVGLMALLVIAKTSWKRILPKAFQYTTVLLGVVTIGLVALFASDFDKYFTKFHEMFFTNDLWVLDPATSLLINILPEGFFVDIASRVGIIFGILLVISFAAATLCRIKPRKKRKMFK